MAAQCHSTVWARGVTAKDRASRPRHDTVPGPAEPTNRTSLTAGKQAIDTDEESSNGCTLT